MLGKSYVKKNKKKLEQCTFACKSAMEVNEVELSQINLYLQPL